MMLPIQTASVAASTHDTPADLRQDSNKTGLSLVWRAGALRSPDTALQTAEGETLVFGEVQIPAQIIAVRMNDERAVQPLIQRVISERMTGKLPAATDDQSQEQRAAAAMPQLPIVVLREAHARGVRVVVLAILAYYQEQGQWRALRELDVDIPGAQTLDLNSIDYTAEMHSTTVASTASNPAAAMTAYTLTVSAGGIQHVTGAALSTAGLNIAATAPQNLRVYRNGAQLAIQVTGAQDGQFNTTDEVRFYAPTPGDRWNRNDVYWLTVETPAGLRMALQNASVINAALRPDAMETGTWQDDQSYQSLYPGIDADHWFAMNLSANTGQPASGAAYITSTLSPAADEMQLSVYGTSASDGSRTLSATFNGMSNTNTWSGTGDFTRTYGIGVLLGVRAAQVSSNRAFSIVLQLTSPGGIQSQLIDWLDWERPVTLDFASNGGRFKSYVGTWCYQAQNWPTGGALYDVTNPLAPVVLTTTAGTSPQFCPASEHQFVVSGAGTTYTPTVAKHTPIDLLSSRATQLIYITPQTYMSTLQPLVNLRVSQGYTVTLVDVQQIYDTWSYGAVSPDAIRAFIQQAVTVWKPAPIAFTLVGDGTVDPFDVTKKGAKNVNIIPPYMADIDPFLGETACEGCYSQVDGASPLSDLLPDTLIGRLPVRTTTELTTVVNKIVAYEQASPDPTWMSKMGFVTDNFRASDGSTDLYGDFSALAEQSIALQPSSMQIERMYYDPYLPTATGVPYREPNSAVAHSRTLAVLNAGAAIVQYGGHGNYFQWAVTENSPGNLFFIDEPNNLTNGTRLPIVLEMTCYTSAFQTPLSRGIGIDEQMVLAAGGGAIATWGPAGNPQIMSHRNLMTGFYNRLWATPRATRVVGELTYHGYLYLYAHNGCCFSPIQSYVLLGDPITRARVMSKVYVYLPIALKPN